MLSTSERALDEAYHRLRYARRDAVPPPHIVFEKVLGRGSIINEAADALMETLPADLHIEESDDPLHTLYRLRWREGAWLFGPSSHWRLDERLEPGEPTTTPKRNDPVAAPTIHKWRDSARTWACREYAYAVPGDEALDAFVRADRRGGGVVRFQRGDADAGTLAHATPGDAAALLALLPSRQVATHPLHREATM